MSDLEYLLEFTRQTVFDLVPEIPLYIGEDNDVKRLHQRLGIEVDPPFWAFVWPGGQALARYILDNPELVAGKRVLEIGPGSGIDTIAAALARPKSVSTFDTESYAIDLTRLNVDVHSAGRVVDYNVREVRIEEIGNYDIVIMGDCFYDGWAAYELTKLVDEANRLDIPFIIGDPKREYTPVRRCHKLAGYNVTDTLKLEGKVSTPAFVYQVLGNDCPKERQ